ncbi:MAG: hypothetical protein JO025_12105 [Verrucomicrobia bacterium]|nr:hypothetical protein [Verrucomicrobiota bacterium]
MSSHKRVICSQYWNGEPRQGARSKKDLAGSVFPFFLGRSAYWALEIPHHGNVAFGMLKRKTTHRDPTFDYGAPTSH